jgi:hypothetical protein
VVYPHLLVIRPARVNEPRPMHLGPIDGLLSPPVLCSRDVTIPTLQAFTRRKPPIVRSNCMCVCPQTTRLGSISAWRVFPVYGKRTLRGCFLLRFDLLPTCAPAVFLLATADIARLFGCFVRPGLGACSEFVQSCVKIAALRMEDKCARFDY